MAVTDSKSKQGKMMFVHSTSAQMSSDNRSSHSATVGADRGREREMARQKGQELFGTSGMKMEISDCNWTRIRGERGG